VFEPIGDVQIGEKPYCWKFGEEKWKRKTPLGVYVERRLVNMGVRPDEKQIKKSILRRGGGGAPKGKPKNPNKLKIRYFIVSGRRRSQPTGFLLERGKDRGEKGRGEPGCGAGEIAG